MSTILGTVMNPEVIRGKSAYEIAVAHGFEGTEEEWLDSLTDETAEKAEKMIAEQKAAALDEIEKAGEDTTAEFAKTVREDIIPGLITEAENDIENKLTEAQNAIAAKSEEAETAIAEAQTDAETAIEEAETLSKDNIKIFSEEKEALLREAAQGFDEREVLLWKNDTYDGGLYYCPDFEAQTIDLAAAMAESAADIDRFKILFFDKGSPASIMPSVEAIPGLNGIVHFADSANTYSREFYAGDTSINFKAATPGNGYCIPYRIYGVKAKGFDVDFAKGDPGENGKSAYEYAKEGGYTGTEAEFAALFATLKEVEANPEAEATETLTKIGVGGTVYSVPQGDGSGTLVEANPPESSEADLMTLKVGGTVYNIPPGDMRAPADEERSGLIYYYGPLNESAFVTLGDGLKLEGTVLSLDLEEAEGASF